LVPSSVLTRKRSPLLAATSKSLSAHAVDETQHEVIKAIRMPKIRMFRDAVIQFSFPWVHAREMA
jgi:hypothetical protein